MQDYRLNSSAPVDPVATAASRIEGGSIYTSPTLKIYGTVVEFTKGDAGTKGDGPGSKRASSKSDPSVKENIVRIGEHPLGFGLYLFDYKPCFREACGQGRQFGVMADEVERLVPAAVSLGSDGYRLVDYDKLGILRHLV